MKVLLICPENRASMSLLSQRAPLGNIPLLGLSLLEYWMSHLAANGVKEVTVLAADRCEQVKALVDNGARWGLTANVYARPPQLSPLEEILQDPTQPPPPVPDTQIAVLDHFPGFPAQRIFESYRAFADGLTAWIPYAFTPDRVDMRELRPGVYVGTHAVIHPSAELHAPCWIGTRAHVGAGCVIGPNAVIEHGAFLDSRAEVVGSIVRPDTFVGRYTSLKDCLARGATLVDLATGVETQVPDPFVLTTLRPLRPFGLAGGFTSRLAELVARHKSDVVWAWRQLSLRKES